MASIARFFGKKRASHSQSEEHIPNATNSNGNCACKCKCKEKSQLSKQGKSKGNHKEKYKENESNISTDGDSTDVKPQTKRFSKQEQQNLSGSCCGADKVSAAGMEYQPTGNGNMDYTPDIPEIAYMPVSQNSPDYNMNHPRRGKAVIFNFDRWDNTNFPYLDLQPRLGSKKDKDDLAKCFRGLDFDVEEYNNLKCSQFEDKLGSLRREDHSLRDCLVVAIMTHGERNLVYMSDGIIMPVNLIWEKFEAHECPTLAGKPKIFIIQACRGKKYDPGTVLHYNRLATQTEANSDVVDSGAFSYVIPNAADIIVAFSCPLGHYSWRSPEKGSWFIQAICKVFGEHGLTMELQGLFTTVAREVALNYSSQTYQHDSHNMRQVTSTSSTLIRNVYFPPKPPVPRIRELPNRNQILQETVISTQLDSLSIEEVPIRNGDDDDNAIQMTCV